MTDRKKRLEKIREAKAALEKEAKERAKAEGKAKSSQATPEDKAQRNFTDPQSRIMKTGNGFEQCYNAQAAVDAKNQIIVAQHVTSASNDKKLLLPMLSEIRKMLGRYPDETSADAGYCSEENLKEVDRRRINAYIATGRQKHGASSPGCRQSPAAPSRVNAMAVKLRRGGYRSRYRLRKTVVEPVFGQIKHARAFRQFLMRGQEKVSAEWALLCTAHNLLKLAATTD